MPSWSRPLFSKPVVPTESKQVSKSRQRQGKTADYNSGWKVIRLNQTCSWVLMSASEFPYVRTVYVRADSGAGWRAGWAMCCLSWRETSTRTCSPGTWWTTCSTKAGKPVVLLKSKHLPAPCYHYWILHWVFRRNTAEKCSERCCS